VNECRCCGRKGAKIQSLILEEYFCDYDCMGFYQCDSWNPERGKTWRNEVDGASKGKFVE
jgi:hypothetical protein